MKRFVYLVVLAAAAVAHAGPPSGKEVLEKQEEARKLSSFEAKATLTTSKSDQADKKTKAFRWWRKLKGDTRFVTLTRFDEPATIRGEALLIREADAENDVLLYLPRFKKVRRVEGQSQSSSFFGSVFSYSDVAMSHADENKAKVLREEKCPGQDALKCWVVEITPATDKIRDRTGYSRSTQWVRQDNWITVYGEFFDKKNVLWKRYTASEVKEVDTKAHKWVPHIVQFEDVPGKKLSVLRLADVKVNAAVDDSLFTEQSLANE